MHYIVYPDGKFAKKLKSLLDFLGDTYETLDDSLSEKSLENFIKTDDIKKGAFILSAEKIYKDLEKKLLANGINDFLNGLEFYESKMKTISDEGLSSYWSAHMVETDEFDSENDSLRHFHWRNRQYIGYIDLMPVNNQDNKIVLDYGCGPGNDLVGFSIFSNCKKLIGADISSHALAKAKKRLDLHKKSAEFIKIDEHLKNNLPLDDSSVDYIHCSGVLMNTHDEKKILKEFLRVLKDDGEIRIMVYNKNSIWYHLYAAFIWKQKNIKYLYSKTKDIFKHTTDGIECPISKCYEPESFIQLVESMGFKATLTGVSISLNEMNWIQKRFEALMSDKIDDEHVDFLMNLTFNNEGIPYYKGNVAGIDSCFLLKKINNG